MMRIGLAARAAAYALLIILMAFSVDSLLLKFSHPSARLLPAALACVLALSLPLRAAARRVAESQRGPIERMWSAMDIAGVIWLAVFLVLLTIFHYAFERAGGDGRAYFAQLRSVVIDHDLDLSNEARDFGAQDPGIFPFGSAILWMPFYLVAHVWLRILNAFGGGFRRDGYFYPYQMAVGLGSLTYGFAGLVLIYKVACDYFSRWLSLSATLAVCAGSFILWYLVIENSYSHGNSLFAVTLFLFIWHRTRTTRSRAAWAWLGAAGGLMVMVRWQNAVFLAPLVPDALSVLWRAVRGIDRSALRAAQGPAFAAFGFVAAFLPQMYFFKVVNGGWLRPPFGQTGQQWWAGSLMLDVLFSPNHGLLAWQPIVYLSVLGTPFFLMRDPYFASLLTLLFAAQVYINGAVATWWGGAAFGGRRFDGCAMFFVLGLGALIQWCQKRPNLLWAFIVGTLLVGNIFFMEDVYSGKLPMSQGISVEQMLDSTTRRLGNPFSFPASVILAWRTGADPAAYERAGQHLYNAVTIDLGAPDDEQFLASGWSGREQQNNLTYRWAVGRRSMIVVPLLGRVFLQPGEPQRLADYTLTVSAAPFTFPGRPPQGLSVEINGTPLGRQILQPGFSEYGVDVPHELLKRNLNIIAFDYDYARSPSRLGMGDDPRELSVRFDYIRFVPKTAARR